MDMTIEIDLGQAARELNLPVESVQSTVALLDEDNTVPFITRYRKDQTGALDEEQVRRIREKIGKLRGLAERKQTIFKSLHSQGVLTAELEQLIRQAVSLKRLEDLYLPYKPKKQTLATLAKKRGLEPLARDVLNGQLQASEWRERAEVLVNPADGLSSSEDVIQGLRHIIAERFSEDATVRGRLRRILKQSGKLSVSRMEPPKQAPATGDAGGETAAQATEAGPAPGQAEAAETSSSPSAESSGESQQGSEQQGGGESRTPTPASGSELSGEARGHAEVTDGSGVDVATPSAPAPRLPVQHAERTSDEESVSAAGVDQGSSSSRVHDAADGMSPSPTQEAAAAASESSLPPSSEHVSPVPTEEAERSEEGGETTAGSTRGGAGGEEQEELTAAASDAVPNPSRSVSQSTQQSAQQPRVMAAESTGEAETPGKPARKSGPLSASMAKKAKKRKRLEAAFKDYFDFQESVSRIPPHRVLAINRGERARILRVKIDADLDAMLAEAESLLIPEDHLHKEFLKDCLRDALSRLLLPSLERELRREMTEKAEQHAVSVFARNLSRLLLQPPVYHRRVLAIDPGFRNGCKLIALDEFGNPLGHDIIHVIGKEEWIRKGRSKMVKLIQQHQLSVVAIGNGAGCRETEQLVVDVMENELKDQDIAFVIVNEAGASVYSTSQLGREELPSYDAVLRSSISIGRRLLDPLSELVKINPANIGVGMYQHDVKAKHLQKSLDAVVESCVNYVGVDANTASPSLLRYVSGMNQLTARRLCEYRAVHGPFRNREQFKSIPGFGEATFVQAAGFLRITSGDTPLDATWIHPESYALAERVLAVAGCSVEDLRVGEPMPQPHAREFGQLTPDAESETPVANVAVSDGPAEAAAPDVRDENIAEEAEEKAEKGTEDTAEETDGEHGDKAVAPLEKPPARQATAATAGADPAEQRHAEGDSSAVASSTSGDNAAGQEGNSYGEQMPDGKTEPAAVSSGQREEPAASLPPNSPVDAPAPRLQGLAEKVRQLDAKTLANEWDVSEIRLRDIVDSLARPGRDPREDLPPPVFRHGVVKLEDLEPGMRLSGTVLNVVDFGAFIDIGLPDSGLVHISRLADRYVRDPHEVVGVGDVLDVWVVDLDKKRRRVSLTAIEPGTEKPRETTRRSGKRRENKTDGNRAGSAKPRRDNQQRGKGRTARGKGQKSRPPRKPKPVTPITKEMEEGKEPLRSFSDLMQFYQKKQDDE